MIQQLFDDKIRHGLFTDYNISIRGSHNYDFKGGVHIDNGAYLFDVSSLVKALTYLLMWKLFYTGKLSPSDRFSKLMPEIPGSGERELWHFMSYVVQNYAFDYNAVRNGTVKPFKKTLIEKGFGNWEKIFCYDNFASAYIGLFLEKYFNLSIEEILHHEFNIRPESNQLVFHPVFRNLVRPECVVPTKQDPQLRGLVYDPLSLSHQTEQFVSAGLFSNAQTIVQIVYSIIPDVISSGFYTSASVNQLPKVGITDYDFALGFDIPYKESLGGISVDNPIIFAGQTGCRLFVAKNPFVVICMTTNRVYCGGDTLESRQAFSKFFWEVVLSVLKRKI